MNKRNTLPTTDDIYKPPILKCPHCGYDEYYEKRTASGTVTYNLRFDGEETDNSEMYGGLRYRYGKVAYCCQCEKALFRVAQSGEQP